LTRTPAKRILIMEDNALNVELATEVLGAQGYVVLQARWMCVFPGWTGWRRYGP
jgi:hypothetical protein